MTSSLTLQEDEDTVDMVLNMAPLLFSGAAPLLLLSLELPVLHMICHHIAF